MARKKLTQKLLGFPFFQVQTNGFTFPLTHNFTEDFVGLDGLSLNLQFATDKTLTARKGPTPTFTRASNATHYGPLVNFGGETYPTTGIVNERAEWKIVDGSDYKSFEYIGGVWRYTEFFSGEGTTFDSAATSVFRPEQANWSGSGLTSFPTTSSTFGIVRSAINEPRFDHATTAPNACLGLLIEESRTNLVFPSDTLTTQTRTVTAVAHTLSFYGTGTVVLSGVATATVTGTGAFPTRTTLTFTPTAGSLIMTVTGSVTQAQLEAGSLATSYIPTTSASVVRSRDICDITSIASFYGNGVGTILVSSQLNGASQLGGLCGFYSGANQIAISRLPNNTRATTFGSAPNLTINSGTLASTLFVKSAFAFNTNDGAFANNGVSAGTSTSVGIPSVLTFGIGSNGSQQIQSGTISEIKVFKKRLANAKLLTITT
jgi:hypothetical protein